MAKHLLSKATYQRLEAEIAELEHTILPAIADEIGRAREMGDLKENGDYHAAKDSYGEKNDRKNLLLGLLENAETPDMVPAPEAGRVAPLSTVTILFDGDSADMAETYLIGHIEEKTTDPSIEVMSPVSPIGSALLGGSAGDKVSITLENGAKVSVSIVKVSN